MKIRIERTILIKIKIVLKTECIKSVMNRSRNDIKLIDDDNLTRMAVNEILADLDKEKNPVQPYQRPYAPVRNKLNKNFLGRTIQSNLSHNRRQSNRTKQICNQKLKELNEKHERKRKNSPNQNEESIEHNATFNLQKQINLRDKKIDKNDICSDIVNVLDSSCSSERESARETSSPQTFHNSKKSSSEKKENEKNKESKMSNFSKLQKKKHRKKHRSRSNKKSVDESTSDITSSSHEYEKPKHHKYKKGKHQKRNEEKRKKYQSTNDKQSEEEKRHEMEQRCNDINLETNYYRWDMAYDVMMTQYGSLPANFVDFNTMATYQCAVMSQFDTQPTVHTQEIDTINLSSTEDENGGDGDDDGVGGGGGDGNGTAITVSSDSDFIDEFENSKRNEEINGDENLQIINVDDSEDYVSSN